VAKFIIIGAFALVLGAFLIVYERPAKNRKKISGRGGDFES
jgi:hypothetical protein